jgi:hypothetical protein
MENIIHQLHDERPLFCTASELIDGPLRKELREFAKDAREQLKIIKRCFRYSGTVTDLQAEMSYKLLKDMLHVTPPDNI